MEGARRASQPPRLGGDLWQRRPDASLQARHDLALALGHMVSWEYRNGQVSWSAPVETVIRRGPGTPWFRVTSAARSGDELPRRDSGYTADLGEALLAPVLEVVRQGAPWETYEVTQKIEGPEGELHQVTVAAVPLPDPEGPCCAGVVAAAAQSSEVEQALHDLIDRYRQLIELSPDAIIVHQDGYIVYGNPSALRLVRLERWEDAWDRKITDFLHPDSTEETLARIAELRQPGDVSPASEAVIVAADGTTTVVEATSVLTSWQGRPAYQVILRDISERRRAEAALRYQASLVTHVSDAIIGIDAQGRIESWNPAAEATYGWTAEEAIGQPVTSLLTGGRDRGTMLEGGERIHLRKDGHLIETRVSLSPLLDDLGRPAGWVAVCTEVTEARRAEAARRAAEERYAAVVAALEEGILVVDGNGALTASNHAAQRILGSRLETGHGDSLFAGGQVATHEDGSPFAPSEFPIAATLRTGQPQTQVVMGVVDDDGRRQWLSISSRLLTDSTRLGAHTVMCSFSDITDRKAAEAQLNWQASHDHLTGLANRAHFVKTLERSLALARHQRSRLAVLYIDLDRFKMVNDSLGHNSGDEVLIATARRLESAVRSGDLVSRVAGDEFAVLCRDLSSLDAAVKLAEALNQIVSQPLTVSTQREVVVTASIGVAFSEGGRGEAQELVQDADVAMFRAKEKGRGRVEVFDEVLRRRARARLEVHEDLRQAIARDGLSVHYQPLATVEGNRIVGMEALVRWEHPTRGLLPPAEFIPLAEETDLILSLGGWVLGEACATMAAWRKGTPGAQNAYIAVNLSARQLADPDLAAAIRAALDSSGLPPKALVLEVTESTLMADAASASAVLAEIRAMGVRLAIDDFGTGYSSLAHLKRFSVDFLKIDRSFIDGLGTDDDDAAIVAAIVELGHTLDLSIVAEGVETQVQLEEVRRLGCDLFQGYLLARPVPPEEVRFAGPSEGPKLVRV
jgi:diguanylate cyclase (GGDEF)-like protein/PAS domain S-box-containing protein